MAKTDIQILIDRVQELTSKSITGTNPLVITDTNANVSVGGMSIYAIVDTTFTVLNTGAEGNTLQDQTLSAGHMWYVPVRDVTLASGSVIVYRH